MRRSASQHPTDRLVRGGVKLRARRLLPIVLGLLLVLGSLGAVRALAQVAAPGGAPPPRSGPFRPTSYVRVLDGDTFEVVIDGRRTAVGTVGVAVEAYGTPCGDAARSQLQSLVGRGVVLEDDPAQVFDAKKRRMYRVSTTDGRSVAAELVGAGLGRATGLGSESSLLAALEAKARQNATGCIWGGTVPAVAASAGLQVAPAAAAQVPANFVDDPVAGGLSVPTSFAFLPDGRVLATEKRGILRLITASGLDPTIVMDIRSRVNDWTDRGLLSVTVDPNFATNRRFYLFYVHENNAADLTGPKSSRLVRYTLAANNTADPNAGVVILGTQVGAGCPALPSTADCLPAEAWSHAGGAIRFGPDGRLYVSTGDATNWNAAEAQALRVQDPASLSGKILRIDTDGKGLSDNPRWNGNPDAPISKLWARGFRNPFRMAFRPTGPGGGTLMVGDVGWSTTEEIDAVTSDMNAGWPCYEGSAVEPTYNSLFAACRDLTDDNPPTATGPIVQWGHGSTGNAAVAGSFYAGTSYPAGYQGAMFYGDYGADWIRYVRLDGNNQPIGAPQPFAQGILGPVQIEYGPDEAIWYLSIGSGEVRKIRYVGNYTPISCPDGQFRAEYFNNQDFNAVPALARCEQTIDYVWGYGSPSPSVWNDLFVVRWTGRFTFSNDTYDFSTFSDDGVRVFVDGQTVIDDWVGGPANTVNATRVMTAGAHNVVVEYFEDTAPAEIHVSWVGRNPNTAPNASIASPTAGTTFKVGSVIALQGSATDGEQGTIPSENLQWDIIMKHCPGGGADCHDHPLQSLTGANQQFTVPDHGDGTRFEIRLTATDNRGLTSVATREIAPKTLQITLAASPNVGTVSYDTIAHTPPFTTTTIAGSKHKIGAQPPGGQLFGGWAHGGPQEQDVTVGEQNVTYTANMGGACAPRPRVNVDTTPAAANARQVTVTTSTNPGDPANLIQSIQFTELRGATVEAAGTPATSTPPTLTYAGGAAQATFVARRSQSVPILVRFTVTDACGAWTTFVGSGSSTGF